MKGLGSALGFLLVIVLSNFLGDVELAEFYMLINSSLVISIFLRLGMDNTIIRATAVNKNTYSVFIGAFKYTIIFTFIISAVLFLYNLFLGSNDSINVYLILIFSFIVSVAQLLCASAKGRGENVWAAFIESVPAPLVTLLIFMIFKVEPANLAFWYFLSMLMCSSYYYLFFIKPSAKFPSIESETRILSLKYMLSDSMNFLMVWASFFLLDLMASADASATYNLLLRLALLSNIFIVVINGLSARKIAQYFKDEDVVSILDYSRQQAFVSLAIAVSFSFFVVMGVFLFPEMFLIDSSEKFVCLVILFSSQVFNAFTGPTGVIIAMANKQNLVFCSTLVSFCICIISQFLLIDRYALIGAAIGTAVGIVSNNLLLSIYSSRILKGYVYPKIRLNFKNKLS